MARPGKSAFVPQPDFTYGPEGGIISGMTEEDERDHVNMLLERLYNDDPVKKRTAAESIACYIGDQRHLPDDIELHPAKVLADVVLGARKINKMECVHGARAIALMGSHAGPHASKALARLIGHNDYDIKWEVIRAVRIIGPGAAEGDSGVPAALATAVMEEEYQTLRCEAARALGAIGPGAAADGAAALAKALKDEDTEVCNAAVNSLAAMGPGAAANSVDALRDAVKHGPFEMRRFAVHALAQMGEAAAAAAPVLGRLLRPDPGSDEVLRRLAAEALRAMGRAATRQQMLWLARAVADPDEEVRSAVVETLKAAGCKRALRGSMALAEPETEDEAPLALEDEKPSGLSEPLALQPAATAEDPQQEGDKTIPTS